MQQSLRSALYFFAKRCSATDAHYQAAHDVMPTTGFWRARNLQEAALHNRCVGWRNASDTYHVSAQRLIDLAARNPSYTARYPNSPFPGT